MVRALESYPDQFTKGKLYTVREDYNGYGHIPIEADDRGSTSNGWGPENFEYVIVTNTPRPGDTVANIKARARGSDIQPQTPQGVREFGTGATRDLDANKLDFEGFLSPLVLERYAEHMHKARKMPDGSMRESDNWQLGIPIPVYMKSLWRHFFAVWKLHRGLPVTEVVKGETIVKDLETELCATLFNTSGMLHEVLKAKKNA